VNKAQGSSPVTPDDALHIDETCDRFEAAWRAGERPDPAAYLGATVAALRPQLLRQLMLLDWEYRRVAGELPRPDDYHPRFPNDADLIEEIAREMIWSANAGTPTSGTDRPFDTPPAGDDANDSQDSSIGRDTESARYDLLAEVGRGGIGIVFRGRDRRLGRELAVKVLRDAYHDRPGARRRFVAEARVGSRLQHPAIVPVYELGQFADGRPYITMKLVEGQTLAALLTDRPAPLQDLDRWLGVFEQVCQAMAYAHSRGIIHRDLKPGNVMVGAFGEVQIMDWGFAREVSRPDGGSDADSAPPLQAIGGEPLARESGGLCGTPAYMPPEQARGESRAIDPRADVFALGAMLCEILTGRPPYAGVPDDDVYRRAAAGELTNAFARLDASGADEPLRDLTRRCLAVDAADRPADAGAVARDVTDYVSSTQERLRQAELERAAAEARSRAERRARRVTLVLAVALLVGGAAAVWKSVVATRAEQMSVSAASAEAAAKDEAAAKEAETRAVLDFVLNKVLASARPKDRFGGLGGEVTLRRAFEATLPSVSAVFAHQPLTEARVRLTLGVSFLNLGDFKTAAEQFRLSAALYEEHLGPDHAETLRSMSNLANSYDELGRYADGARVHGEVLARRRETLGADHPETLRVMGNLAMCYFALGRRDEALSLRQETLDRQRAVLGTDQPDTLRSMDNLAVSYSAARRFPEALRLFEDALDRRKALLGPDDHETLSNMNNLAMAYAEMGRKAEALALREETLGRQKKVLGPDHPSTLRTMNNVANSYHDLGRWDDSLKLYRETLVLQTQKLGPDHPDTLNSMWGVSANLIKLDREAEALPVLDDCLRRAVGKTAHRSIAAVAELRLRHFEKAKDARGSRETAELWEKLERRDRASLFTAAKIRAVTARLIREADPSPDGVAQSKAEADRAMAWLEESVAAGFRSVDQFKDDKDLEPLQSRADFQRLLGSIAPQSKTKAVLRD
jgi:tetratricopeptide (TPR) repeat protein